MDTANLRDKNSEDEMPCWWTATSFCRITVGDSFTSTNLNFNRASIYHNFSSPLSDTQSIWLVWRLLLDSYGGTWGGVEECLHVRTCLFFFEVMVEGKCLLLLTRYWNSSSSSILRIWTCSSTAVHHQSDLIIEAASRLLVIRLFSHPCSPSDSSPSSPRPSDALLSVF